MYGHLPKVTTATLQRKLDRDLWTGNNLPDGINQIDDATAAAVAQIEKVLLPELSDAIR